MGNEIAIRILTRPGQEVLAEERSHVVQYELAGMAVLSGVMPRIVRADDGLLTADDIRAARRPAAYYRSDLGLVVLENTHNLAGGDGGRRGARCATPSPPPRGRARPCTWTARACGTPRWRSASSRARWSRARTRSMVTLSKGLCAPAGSLLARPPRRCIEEARRVRKQLGGGMRQVGILAAAGLRRPRDHDAPAGRGPRPRAPARRRAGGAAAARALAPVRTNIVVAELVDPPGAAANVVATLARRGVLASAMDARTLRLVTHHDVSRADCERAGAILAEILA